MLHNEGRMREAMSIRGSVKCGMVCLSGLNTFYDSLIDAGSIIFNRVVMIFDVVLQENLLKVFQPSGVVDLSASRLLSLNTALSKS